MYAILVLVVELIGGVSILINSYAFYAFIGKSKQKLGCTIVPLVVALNIMYTICYTLLVPVPFVYKFCVVFVASGSVSSGKIGTTLFVVELLIWHACLFTLVNSFVKKYTVLCRSEYRFIYSSPKWMSVVVVVNIVILISCSFNYAMPAGNIGEDMQDTILSVTGLNLETHSYIGFCAKPNNILDFLLRLNILVVRAILLTVGFYCAYAVRKKLSSSFLSERTKVLQRRFNNMLIAQTFCVALLLQAPSVVYPFLQYYGATSSPAAIIFSTLLFSFFPACSPIIIIVSLKCTKVAQA